MAALFPPAHEPAGFQLRQMSARRRQRDACLGGQLAHRESLAAHQRRQHVGPRRVAHQRGKQGNVRTILHTSIINEVFWSRYRVLCDAPRPAAISLRRSRISRSSPGSPGSARRGARLVDDL